MRSFTVLCLGAAMLAQSSAVLAEPPAGSTTGPAVKKDVEPPTVTEKRYEGRSTSPEEGNPATGMPGVEGKPGTESGDVPRGAPPLS